MIGALTGVLASRNTASEFFTSVLYPFVTTDTLLINGSSIQTGSLWQLEVEPLGIGIPVLQGGALTETIAYKSYNDAVPDPMSIGVPTLQGGALTETIAYRSYNDAVPDPLSIPTPTLLSGSLVETISYVTYDPTTVDNVVRITAPTLLSGTLL